MTQEQNTCDKCHCIYHSESLIWITADDFEPFVGEIVPEEAYTKYDALCQQCYEEVIKQ